MLFAFDFQEMQYGEIRVTEQHAGPRIAHNLPDFFSHRRLVTMNRTCSADRFPVPVWAPVYALQGIAQQRPTF